MREMVENLGRRKWAMMAAGEAEDVVLPCLVGVCEYASMEAFVLFFVFSSVTAEEWGIHFDMKYLVTSYNIEFVIL